MLKSITLHRPAIDNLGGFHDAGADLDVGDASKVGVIAEDRAKELVSGHGASGHHSAPAKPRRPAAPASAKAKKRVAATAGDDKTAQADPKGAVELAAADTGTSD